MYLNGSFTNKWLLQGSLRINGFDVNQQRWSHPSILHILQIISWNSCLPEQRGWRLNRNSISQWMLLGAHTFDRSAHFQVIDITTCSTFDVLADFVGILPSRIQTTQNLLQEMDPNRCGTTMTNANCCHSNRYNKARVLTLSGKSSAFYLTVARMSSKDLDWAEFDIAIWLNDDASGRFRMICSTLHWLQINHLYSVPKSAFTCPSPQCDRYRSLQELCWLLWHEFPMMNVQIDIFLRPSAGLDNFYPCVCNIADSALFIRQRLSILYCIESNMRAPRSIIADISSLWYDDAFFVHFVVTSNCRWSMRNSTTATIAYLRSSHHVPVSMKAFFCSEGMARNHSILYLWAKLIAIHRLLDMAFHFGWCLFSSRHRAFLTASTFQDLLFDNWWRSNAQGYNPTETQALYHLLEMKIFPSRIIALPEHCVGRTIASTFQSHVSGSNPSACLMCPLNLLRFSQSQSKPMYQPISARNSTRVLESPAIRCINWSWGSSNFVGEAEKPQPWLTIRFTATQDRMSR